MTLASSSTRFAIQYVMAALVAFVGSAVLLKGIAISPGGPPQPGLLSYVVAALLILTGAVLIVLAATELVRARAPRDGAPRPAKPRRD